MVFGILAFNLVIDSCGGLAWIKLFRLAKKTIDLGLKWGWYGIWVIIGSESIEDACCPIIYAITHFDFVDVVLTFLVLINHFP